MGLSKVEAWLNIAPSKENFPVPKLSVFFLLDWTAGHNINPSAGRTILGNAFENSPPPPPKQTKEKETGFKDNEPFKSTSFFTIEIVLVYIYGYFELSC